jgi:DNA-binding PadR family transcriptional regulator
MILFPSRKEKRVIDILRTHGEMTSGRLLTETGWLSGTLYIVLYRLESQGKIYSAWIPGPYPRSRIYYVDPR